MYECNDKAIAKKGASKLEKIIGFLGQMALHDCNITTADCISIAYFVKHLVAPTKLNLIGNIISDQGVLHLCGALNKENCNVCELELNGNRISDQGISHLCDALKHANIVNSPS